MCMRSRGSTVELAENHHPPIVLGPLLLFDLPLNCAKARRALLCPSIAFFLAKVSLFPSSITLTVLSRPTTLQSPTTQ